MAWEITDRDCPNEGWTMWRGTDAEGRTIWAAIRDRDGVAVEPSSGLYTREAAISVTREH